MKEGFASFSCLCIHGAAKNCMALSHRRLLWIFFRPISIFHVTFKKQNHLLIMALIIKTLMEKLSFHKHTKHVYHVYMICVLYLSSHTTANQCTIHRTTTGSQSWPGGRNWINCCIASMCYLIECAYMHNEETQNESTNEKSFWSKLEIHYSSKSCYIHVHNN